MAAFSCSGMPIPGMEATLFRSTSSETRKQGETQMGSNKATNPRGPFVLLRLTVLHAVLGHPRQQVQVVTVPHLVTWSIPRPEFTDELTSSR